MNKKFISATLALLMAMACATSCGKKGGNSTSEKESVESIVESTQNSSGGQITVETAENFNMGNAISDQEKWLGVEKQNPVFDTTNKFVTFRAKSNNVITYTGTGMSSGDLEFKMKVQINKDTTAYVGFSNQSKDLKEFCYHFYLLHILTALNCFCPILLLAHK